VEATAVAGFKREEEEEEQAEVVVGLKRGDERDWDLRVQQQW